MPTGLSRDQATWYAYLMLGMFGAWWLSVSSRLDPLIAIVPIGLAMFATP